MDTYADVARADLVPDEAQIFAPIERIFAEGVRRPGYPADRWAEQWIQEQFALLGLENVRAEPVDMPSWEPRRAALRVMPSDGDPFDVRCFQLPHSASTDALEAELVAFDTNRPERVRAAVSLYDVPLLRVPFGWYEHVSTWCYDTQRTFDGASHTLPFGREIQAVMGPSADAGAVGFIGVLSGYPGDSHQYYVPYDAKPRAMPGVWISDSAGRRLRDALVAGPARVRLDLEASRDAITSYNIVGELPGRDDETVIIGSHHDGPWASAVEDASGMAMVLAQATYWSRVPVEERPHRLLFLLNCGHMAGGAGQAAFVEQHRGELDRTVLEVHLEHAANEIVQQDGVLRATGRPEARWWFTTRINMLEAAVRSAIEAEDLQRSFVLRPDTFGEKPTTDGADVHMAGVPIVHYLVAPFYLFDAMDTLDKIHRQSLVPVTRAAIRIINSTSGVSAAAMRADRI